MRRLFPDPADDVDLAAAYAHDAGVLRANMVSSVDGSATVEGRSGGLSSAADKALFLQLRTFCDLILVGASTVRQENYGPGVKPIAVVTASLDLDPDARFFAEPKHRPVIVTTEDADPDRRAALSRVCDVLAIGTGRVDLAAAVAALRERGHSRILTEGGPALLAAIAAAEVLDDLCLTVAPSLVGGHGKRIVDGPPHEPPMPMRLVHVLEEEDSLFLRYARL